MCVCVCVCVCTTTTRAPRVQAYRAYPELKKRKYYYYDCAAYHAAYLVQSQWRRVQNKHKKWLEGQDKQERGGEVKESKLRLLTYSSE